MKTDYRPAAFPKRPSATTVRLRQLVDSQQKIEIGLRIKELRDNSAETSRSIADYCDVSVEAVRNWIAGKGISYDNAQKVADLFKRDVDWIWRGREKGATPDPFASPSTEADGELRKELAALRAELLAEIGKVQASQEALLRQTTRGARSSAPKRKKPPA